MTAANGEAGVFEDRLDFQHTLAVLWRDGLVIVAATAIAATVAFAYSTSQPDIYASAARVVVRPVLSEEASDPLAVAVDPLGVELIDTQVEVLRSGAVTERVRAILGADALRSGSITVSALTSDLIEVEARSPNPRMATRLANTYVEQYLELRGDSVRRAITQAAADLEAQRLALEDRLRAIDSRISILSLQPGTAVEIEGLQAERANVVDNIGTMMARKANLLALAPQTTAGGGEVVQRATVPTEPSEPNTARDVAIGLVLGAIVGAASVFVREQLGRRVHTADDAVRAAAAPVLVTVRGRAPWLATGIDLVRSLRSESAAGPDRPEAPHGVEAKIGSPNGSPAPDPRTQESFRVLRAMLVARGLGKRVRRLIVLTPGPETQTAAVVTGLAWACARAGLRTVVVASDLSDRKLDDSFGTSGDRGLADLVTDGGDASSALIPAWTENMLVLPGGISDPEHIDVLGSSALERVLGELTLSSDVVLIGSSPFSSAADAAILTSFAEAALIVVRKGRGGESAVRRTTEMAADLRVPVLGVVLLEGRVVDTPSVPRRPKLLAALGTPNGATEPGPADPVSSTDTSSPTPRRTKPRRPRAPAPANDDGARVEAPGARRSG